MSEVCFMQRSMQGSASVVNALASPEDEVRRSVMRRMLDQVVGLPVVRPLNPKAPNKIICRPPQQPKVDCIGVAVLDEQLLDWHMFELVSLAIPSLGVESHSIIMQIFRNKRAMSPDTRAMICGLCLESLFLHHCFKALAFIAKRPTLCSYALRGHSQHLPGLVDIWTMCDMLGTTDQYVLQSCWLSLRSSLDLKCDSGIPNYGPPAHSSVTIAIMALVRAVQNMCNAGRQPKLSILLGLDEVLPEIWTRATILRSHSAQDLCFLFLKIAPDVCGYMVNNNAEFTQKVEQISAVLARVCGRGAYFPSSINTPFTPKSRCKHSDRDRVLQLAAEFVRVCSSNGITGTISLCLPILNEMWHAILLYPWESQLVFTVMNLICNITRDFPAETKPVVNRISESLGCLCARLKDETESKNSSVSPNWDPTTLFSHLAILNSQPAFSGLLCRSCSGVVKTALETNAPCAMLAVTALETLLHSTISIHVRKQCTTHVPPQPPVSQRVEPGFRTTPTPTQQAQVALWGEFNILCMSSQATSSCSSVDVPEAAEIASLLCSRLSSFNICRYIHSLSLFTAIRTDEVAPVLLANLPCLTQFIKTAAEEPNSTPFLHRFALVKLVHTIVQHTPAARLKSESAIPALLSNMTTIAISVDDQPSPSPPSPSSSPSPPSTPRPGNSFIVRACTPSPGVTEEESSNAQTEAIASFSAPNTTEESTSTISTSTSTSTSTSASTSTSTSTATHFSTTSTQTLRLCALTLINAVVSGTQLSHPTKLIESLEKHSNLVPLAQNLHELLPCDTEVSS
ncbi:hypothetical protein Pelo_14956 [Pelomyxa schiedti]|nr:hypothetical protein Pelo_14956 [Pelomyxa schiedti]